MFTCADGLHYDTNIGACNWPQLVDCKLQARVRSSDADKAADTQVFSLVKGKQDKKVICYFSNWASLRSGDGKFLPENINASLCTHVVYAFAKLDSQSLTMIPSGPRTDLDQRFYQRVTDFVKKSNPQAKVLLSLGGWSDSSGDKYSRLVNNNKAMDVFVKKAANFIKRHNFDGLVLEWHFPVCWQSDCSRGPSSDRQGFAVLAKKLRIVFKSKKLVLGATLSGYPAVVDQAYDIPSLNGDLDFMNIMTYDFRGFWDKTGRLNIFSGSF